MDDRVRGTALDRAFAHSRSRRSAAHAVRVRLCIALLVGDAIALSTAILMPMAFGHGRSSWYTVLVVAAPIYFGTAFNSGAYTTSSLRTPGKGMSAALRSLLFTFGALFLISYFLRVEQRLSRLLLIATMVMSTTLLVLIRQIVAQYVKTWVKGAIFSELFVRDQTAIDCPPGMVLVDAEQHGLAPDLRDPMMMDKFASLIRDVDRVVIACRPGDRRRWAMMLKGADVGGEVLANDFDAVGAFGIGDAGGHLTLVVSTGQLSLQQRIIKRSLDLALSVPALLAIAPVMIMVAVAIKLDSRGPVFFRQRRVGRANAFFEILKFRSMHVAQSDSDGAVSTQRDDARITRVGRFIRRTSVDELPQLLNVVFGSMSLVGPRPHALGSLAGEHLFWDVDERYWHRHALKPGITGLAQVRGFRGATHHRDDLTRRLQADLEYVANWSIWRDISILASTTKVVVHHNTY